MSTPQVTPLVTPKSTFQYGLNDLLDKPDAIEYFRKALPSVLEIIIYLKQNKRNDHFLNILISHSLIKPEDLDDLTKNIDWIPEYYVAALKKAFEEKATTTIDFLFSCQQLLNIDFSKELLYELIKKQKVSLKQAQVIEPHSFFLLAEIFEKLLDESVIVIYIFKETLLLEKVCSQFISFQKMNQVRKIVEKGLLKLESLQRLQHPLPLEFIENELSNAAQDPYQNLKLILVLLDLRAGCEVETICKLAKCQDNTLLKKLTSLENISEALFQMIEYDQETRFKNLFQAGNCCFRDSDLRNSEGNTLLVEAVKSKRLRFVETLLEHLANPLILDNKGQSVFELAKNNPPMENILYHHRSTYGNSTSCSNNDEGEEEIALKKFLEKHAKGQPASHFYCLFIKINNVALAILKKDKFSDKMLSSESESRANRATNRIHCWSSSVLYPIPQDFMPNHTSMDTIGISLVKPLKGNTYHCNRLENIYMESKPSENWGFKYSNDMLQTHGHGKNPEAARSAFKVHRDGIKLKNWKTTPDISDFQKRLTDLNDQLQCMFEKEQESADQMSALESEMNSFIASAESIIEARYITNSSQKFQEDHFIKENHGPIREKLKKIPSYIFDDKKFREWQTLIHDQILYLKEMENKLLLEKPMDSSIFEGERKQAIQNLDGLKDLIVNRTVTSSEMPTLKIYSSSLFLEDVFQFSQNTVDLLKKTICQLGGSSFKNIPPLMNETLFFHFSDRVFREKMLNQLNEEAQFLIQSKTLKRSVDMQILARNLAYMQDTSKILNVSLNCPQVFKSNQPTNLLTSTMNMHVSSYFDVRKTLDNFWKIVPYDEELTQTHLDRMFILIIQRLLLMDEEIRRSEGKTFLYPAMDERHPKQMLDEQLLLLLTSLLTVLKANNTKSSPILQKIIEFVQLKLSPAVCGTEKKKYKLESLFLHHFLEVIPKIKKLVDTVWQANSADDSSFKPFMELLRDYDLPKKGEIEELLLHYFQNLRLNEDLPDFNPKISQLIRKSRELKSNINDLSKFAGSFDDSLLTNLKQPLGVICEVIDYLKIGEKTHAVTPKRLLEIISKGSLSDSEKIELNENIICNLIENLSDNLKKLKQLTNNLSQLEQADEDKIKNIQQFCGTCTQFIIEYLQLEHPPLPVYTDFAKSTLQVFYDLKTTSKGFLESSLNQFPILYKKLQASEGSDEMILGIKKLTLQIKEKLGSMKDKTLLNSCSGFVEKLSQNVSPHLRPILSNLLKGFLTPLENCQKAMYGTYIKKMEKMGEQLSLGIRVQTYYTQTNENVTYYLWDGKPFNALPYHTDDAVHLPLVKDYDWAQSQRSFMNRKMLSEKKLSDLF